MSDDDGQFEEHEAHDKAEQKSRKHYLGDGVYVYRDQPGIILTTENGISITNSIVLEPEVLQSFLTYLGV